MTLASASIVRARRWHQAVAPRGLSALAGALLLLAAAACQQSPRPIVFTSDLNGNLDIFSVSPLGEDITNLTNTPIDEWSPVLSPDGQLVSFRSGTEENNAIEVIDTDGGGRVKTTRDVGVHRDQRWSPNSRRLAYVLEGEDGPAMYVANTDGSNALQLTTIQGDQVGDWSKDGQAVVFAVREGAAQGIYWRNPDGVNEVRITDTPDHSPVWSPDSNRIGFLSTRDGNADIYAMNADGTDQVRLTDSDEDESGLSWSPNGRRLVFVSERDGNPEIYVMNVDGTEQTRLTFNEVVDAEPVWSPDGQRIAFVSHLDGDAEIFTMDFRGGTQTRITNNDAQDTSPSW